MAGVELRGITKSYGEKPIIQGFDLIINDAELLVLVGPSGCGKSTILRLIAGLEEPDAGDIVIDREVVTQREPKNRDVAMVFQDYALYPHMTVAENLGFGLRMRKQNAPAIAARVQQVAEALNIEDLLPRRPRELSGGQRQRVAMGRALVRNPRVFLLDEPLSNLDAKLRTQVRVEIKKLHQSVGGTMVYVTHDQVEAMTLADRIVVLRHGVIEQIGTPREVYGTPRTMFVAGFIGVPTMNFISCRLVQAGARLQVWLDAQNHLTVPPSLETRYQIHAGRDLILGLRPEALMLTPTKPNGDLPTVSTVIDMVEPLGSETLYSFNVGEVLMVAKMVLQQDLARGEHVFVNADMTQMHLFDPATSVAL